MKKFSQTGWVLAVILAVGLGGMVGCTTGTGGGTGANNGAGEVEGMPDADNPGEVQRVPSEMLRVGDQLTIRFNVGGDIVIEDHEERIPSSGKITLPLIGGVVATNLTRVELQERIRNAYVPNIYKNMTVTVDPGQRYFTVGGDVRNPNRYQYINNLTVLDAIAQAGGFTEFGDKRRVVLTRADGERLVVNCVEAQRDSRQDAEVLPGDKIDVPRVGVLPWLN